MTRYETTIQFLLPDDQDFSYACQLVRKACSAMQAECPAAREVRRTSIKVFDPPTTSYIQRTDYR